MSDVDPERHRIAARMFASGVTVAAAQHEGLLHAITATAFCSLSLRPPLVLLAVRTTGRLLDVVRGAGHFAVSILGTEQHHIGEWASQPGRTPGAEVEVTETVTASTGAPIIPGAIAWFDCRLASISRQGDHTVLVGAVVDAWAATSGEPLLYFQGGYHALGERLTGR